MMALRKFIFGRYGHLPPVRFLGREAEKTVKAFRNQDYDMRRNGEIALLRRLQRTGFFTREPMLFDIGANTGDWTAAALEILPDARVCCFEMMPETAEQLQNRFEARLAVTVVPSALADREGTMPATLPKNPEHAALTETAGGDNPVIEVPVTTGDAWMAANGVGHVDFLKIDVEGWSLHVLRGFEQALASGSVHGIQFEYNPKNIGTRTFLLDIYRLLEFHNYAVGKIFPGRVEFSPWSVRLEDLRGPNFFALPRDTI